MSVSSIGYNTEFRSLKAYTQEQMGSKAYSEILSMKGEKAKCLLNNVIVILNIAQEIKKLQL